MKGKFTVVVWKLLGSSINLFRNKLVTYIYLISTFHPFLFRKKIIRSTKLLISISCCVAQHERIFSRNEFFPEINLFQKWKMVRQKGGHWARMHEAGRCKGKLLGGRKGGKVWKEKGLVERRTG
jgi:hypothetical protein